MRFQIKRNNKHQDHSQYGKHFQFSNRYEPAFFFTAVLRLLQSGAGKTEQIKYTDAGNKSQRRHQNHSLSINCLFQSRHREHRQEQITVDIHSGRKITNRIYRDFRHLTRLRECFQKPVNRGSFFFSGKSDIQIFNRFPYKVRIRIRKHGTPGFRNSQYNAIPADRNILDHLLPVKELYDVFLYFRKVVFHLNEPLIFHAP